MDAVFVDFSFTRDWWVLAVAGWSYLPVMCCYIFRCAFLFLQESHMCAVLVSEENEEPIIVEESKSGERTEETVDGRWCISFASSIIRSQS